MLTVIGGLAEFERELIKDKTSEGRELAKRAGIRMGRGKEARGTGYSKGQSSTLSI
jgi:DNA invertase Pin-like site-specific DNA recombinase